MEKIAGLVAKFPKTVVALTLAVTAGAMVLLPGMRMDANPYPLNPSHPSMVAYRELKTDFTGTLETGLIHLRHPRTIFNSATLGRIARLTEEIEAIQLVTAADEAALRAFVPNVPPEQSRLLETILAGGIQSSDDFEILELTEWLESNPGAAPGLAKVVEELRLRLQPIKEVTSLANVENITAKGDELVVGRVFETVPTNERELDRIRASVRSNRIFQKILISEDERSTGIQVETYIPDNRSDLMYALNLAIYDVLEKVPGEGEALVAGFPIMAATFMNAMQRDNEKFFPLVIALVVLALFVTFRGFAGVALPLAVVIISIVWTFAIMVAFGIPMDMMTTTLPVFLIAIGVADGVHLLTEFKDQMQREGTRAKAVLATMSHMSLPVVMTSVTTAVGFVALSFTDVAPIRNFGIFVAVGVIAAMIISLTFIPAVLTFGRQKPAPKKAGRRPWKFDAFALRALVGVSSFAERRNKLVLGFSVLLVAVAAFGLTKMRAENDFLTYFPEDKPVVLGSRALDAYMAGSNVINILVGGPAKVDQPFKQPKYLAAVEGLQNHLAGQSIVGKTTSLVDVLKRINLVMHGNDSTYDRLPRTVEKSADGRETSGRELTAQYLILYENGGGENLTDTVDPAFSTINVTAILNSQNSLEIGRLIEGTRSYAAENFPPGMTVRFAGGAEMSVTTNNEIVNTQVTSLSLSFGLILILLMLQFRSAGKGLMGMVPLVFTVVLNFGFMGFLGIHLNIAIAVMSSIVIGVGVDFAIHYLSRFQLEMERGATQSEAISRTMLASGKAIFANAVIVGLGFLALALSEIYPLQLMGLLISQTLLFSAFATLVLLPAMAAFFRPAFLRAAAVPQPTLAVEGEAAGE